MKKILLILSLIIIAGLAVKAQDDGADDRIRDKMREYIQKRMDLTKNEAEKFTPVFIRYFREWRTTLRDYGKGPKTDLLQKIVEVRLKYRPEFKEILGEKRSNEVFDHQEKFIQELRTIRKERIQNKPNVRPQRVQNLSPI